MATSTVAARSDAQRLEALRPLLASIGREVEERTAALRTLALQHSLDPQPTSAARSELSAQRAAHRRELRHALGELEPLGCTLLSTRPCVFFLLAGSGDTASLHFWRAP